MTSHVTIVRYFVPRMHSSVNMLSFLHCDRFVAILARTFGDKKKFVNFAAFVWCLIIQSDMQMNTQNSETNNSGSVLGLVILGDVLILHRFLTFLLTSKSCVCISPTLRSY